MTTEATALKIDPNGTTTDVDMTEETPRTALVGYVTTHKTATHVVCTLHPAPASFDAVDPLDAEALGLARNLHAERFVGMVGVELYGPALVMTHEQHTAWLESFAARAEG